MLKTLEVYIVAGALYAVVALIVGMATGHRLAKDFEGSGPEDKFGLGFIVVVVGIMWPFSVVFVVLYFVGDFFIREHRLSRGLPKGESR